MLDLNVSFDMEDQWKWIAAISLRLEQQLSH